MNKKVYRCYNISCDYFDIYEDTLCKRYYRVIDCKHRQTKRKAMEQLNEEYEEIQIALSVCKQKMGVIKYFL